MHEQRHDLASALAIVKRRCGLTDDAALLALIDAAADRKIIASARLAMGRAGLEAHRRGLYTDDWSPILRAMREVGRPRIWIALEQSMIGLIGDEEGEDNPSWDLHMSDLLFEDVGSWLTSLVSPNVAALEMVPAERAVTARAGRRPILSDDPLVREAATAFRQGAAASISEAVRQVQARASDNGGTPAATFDRLRRKVRAHLNFGQN